MSPTQGIGTDIYALVTSGTYADRGYENIYYSERCKAAAENLGFTITWGPYGGYVEVVNGCYVRTGNQLFLNPPSTCTTTACKCTEEQPCCCLDRNDSPAQSPVSTPTTASPTGTPTTSLTFTPTSSPTNSPTASPTGSPTNSPTSAPTRSPTAAPTSSPTSAPTGAPTSSPTSSPT